DIIGIFFFFLALLTLFGTIQPSDGWLTKAIADPLAQLFGNGKYIWPAVFMGVGVWLYIRRFKTNPFLVIDYQRVIGGTVLYLTIVTVLQWWALLQVRLPDWAHLVVASQKVVDARGGGGAVGQFIYFLLISITGRGTLSDISIPVLLVGLLLIA